MIYKKIDPASGNSVTSALALFSTPPTNVTATQALYREILTLNPVSALVPWPRIAVT